MLITREWQPLITIERNTSASSLFSEIIQHQTLWLDTFGKRFVGLQSHVLEVDGGTWSLEGCDDINGSFITFASATASPNQIDNVFLTADLPVSDTYRLRRYLRWRFHSFSGTAVACFRIRAILKD